MTNEPVERFGVAARGLHWLTAILVLAAFVLSEGGPETRVFAAANKGSLTLHESLGLAVFVLTLVRLAWRGLDRRPPEIAMPALMHLASRLTHWALFALLLLVPLTAIVGSWLTGHDVSVYVVGDIASPLGTLPLGRKVLDMHTFLGDAILWLAGLHAAAALYHHFVLKDGVLKTMLP